MPFRPDPSKESQKFAIVDREPSLRLSWLGILPFAKPGPRDDAAVLGTEGPQALFAGASCHLTTRPD